jgi:hypothetical protein
MTNLDYEIELEKLFNNFLKHIENCLKNISDLILKVRYSKFIENILNNKKNRAIFLYASTIIALFIITIILQNFIKFLLKSTINAKRIDELDEKIKNNLYKKFFDFLLNIQIDDQANFKIDDQTNLYSEIKNNINNNENEDDIDSFISIIENDTYLNFIESNDQISEIKKYPFKNSLKITLNKIITFSFLLKKYNFINDSEYNLIKDSVINELSSQQEKKNNKMIKSEDNQIIYQIKKFIPIIKKISLNNELLEQDTNDKDFQILLKIIKKILINDSKNELIKKNILNILKISIEKNNNNLQNLIDIIKKYNIEKKNIKYSLFIKELQEKIILNQNNNYYKSYINNKFLDILELINETKKTKLIFKKNPNEVSCCSEDFQNIIFENLDNAIYLKKIQNIFFNKKLYYGKNLLKIKNNIFNILNEKIIYQNFNNKHHENNNSLNTEEKENIKKNLDNKINLKIFYNQLREILYIEGKSLKNNDSSELFQIREEERREMFNYIKFTIEKNKQILENNTFDKFGLKLILNNAIEDSIKLTPQIKKLEKIIIHEKEYNQERIKEIEELYLIKQIIQSKSSYNTFTSKKKNWVNSILYGLWLSFYSICVTLAFFQIASFYKNDSQTYDISFLNFLSGDIQLLNNTNFWIITCVSSSFLFSLCSGAIVKRYKKLEKERASESSSKDLILSFIFNIIKDFAWAILVAIMVLGRSSQKNSIRAIIIAIICSAFISLKLMLNKIDLFDPVGKTHDIEIIKNNIKKSLDKGVNIRSLHETLDKKSHLFNFLESIFYFILKIFCPNNENKDIINASKFVVYLIITFFLSIIIGTLGYFLRKLASNFISKFEYFNNLLSFGFFIEDKYINIINNKNGMLFICLFDCIFGIICAMALYYLSIKIFIYIEQYFENDKNIKNIKNEISKNFKDSQLSDIKKENKKQSIPKKIISFFSKLINLFLYTIFFHIITQIKNSMFENDHDSFKSFVISSMILIIIFYAFLIVNNIIDSSLYGSRCPCKGITVVDSILGKLFCLSLIKKEVLHKLIDETKNDILLESSESIDILSCENEKCP